MKSPAGVFHGRPLVGRPLYRSTLVFWYPPRPILRLPRSSSGALCRSHAYTSGGLGILKVKTLPRIDPERPPGLASGRATPERLSRQKILDIFLKPPASKGIDFVTMAEETSSGLATAVQLALRAEAAAATEDDDEEEPVLDLLGLPNLEAAPKRANLARAGKGRPPGARNHRTQFWSDYIPRRYGSPLEVLAQVMRAPTADLARELGCSKLDAFGEKRKAAEALAPYLHPKLSSVAIYPPGHPLSGVPSTLIIAGQEDFQDITGAVEDTVDVDHSEARLSTLSVAEQEPAASASGGDRNQVTDATIAQALDTLLTLARDPQIRQRMRELLE